MKPHSPAIALTVCLVLTAGFVGLTSASLPPVVASHFGAMGAADGFSSRPVYVGLMLALLVLNGLLLGLLPQGLARRGGAGLNLPNKAYWLAPERREQTLQALRMNGLYLAVLLTAFLAYVHWQVVQANRLQPPALLVSHMTVALGAFLVAMATLVVTLLLRFRKPV